MPNGNNTGGNEFLRQIYDVVRQYQEPAVSQIEKGGGWVRDPWNPGASYTGKPQTEAEQNFIIDYWYKTGEVPDLNVIKEWQAGRDPLARLGDVYIPGSTMYEMGFRNPSEYRTAWGTGETYGPWAGGRVPEGSTILTKGGKPYVRTYTPENYPAYMEAGEYLPTDAELFGERYPEYDRTIKVPQTQQEALSVFSPQDIYQARLTDYLQGLVDADYPKVKNLETAYKNVIDDINDNLMSGNIDEDEATQKAYWAKRDYDRQIADFMTSAKAEDIYNDAVYKLSQGNQVETLPYYAESQVVTGARTNELINRGMTEFRGREEKRIAEIPERKPPVSGQPERYVTGTEQSDFYNFVESLDLANEYKDWLKDQYYNYYAMWPRDQPFVSWVASQLRS